MNLSANAARCAVFANARIIVAVAQLCLLSSGCEGPRGARGATSDAGPRGATGEPGAQGQPGPAGDAGERGPIGLSPDASTPIDPLQLEPQGLVGIVRDPSGQRVSSGYVVLVPAQDVAEQAKESLDLTLDPEAVEDLDTDEPLEDLLDARGQDYARARIGTDGVYVLSELDEGRYFVVFQPDDDDSAHLPGGSACRSALDSESLVGTQLDLRVSGRASETARYVGSSSCFACHGRHRTMATPHRTGLQVPGIRGAYQDTTAWPDLDQGLSAFEASTTLYYYDCDPDDVGETLCKVSRDDPTLDDPGAAVSFEARLDRDPAVARDVLGAYSLSLINRQGSGEAVFAVALTYGGMLFKQQYLARREREDGTLGYFVLPLQWNTAGDDDYPDSDDWVFRDYRSNDWYDFEQGELSEPAEAQSFDGQCAGCHFTGMQLSGDAENGVSAHAVADVSGDFDYDGDGRREEINVGCESCHGPGSEHIEAKTRGLFIVSPSLLTPERETLLCGRCHSRPLGRGAGVTTAPLGEDGRMPPPGLRRAELAARFTTRVDGAPEDFHPSGDSNAHHAQYSDFIRSAMYRNGAELMTCSSCHDAHGSDEHAHSLRRAADDNSACTGCHSQDEFTAPRGHVERATGFVHDGSAIEDFSCTRCHMVRTVASGARHPELLDRIPDSPRVQYFHGDIASHRFSVAPRSEHTAQPVASTLACGFCHGEQLPNP